MDAFRRGAHAVGAREEVVLGRAGHVGRVREGGRAGLHHAADMVGVHVGEHHGVDLVDAVAGRSDALGQKAARRACALAIARVEQDQTLAGVDENRDEGELGDRGGQVVFRQKRRHGLRILVGAEYGLRIGDRDRAIEKRRDLEIPELETAERRPGGTQHRGLGDGGQGEAGHAEGERAGCGAGDQAAAG